MLNVVGCCWGCFVPLITAQVPIRTSEAEEAALVLVLTLPPSLAAGEGQPGRVIFMMSPAQGSLGTVPPAGRGCQLCWRGPAKALLLHIQRYL